jgi:hypothetical protein
MNQTSYIDNSSALSSGKLFGINLPAPITNALDNKVVTRTANQLMQRTFLEVSHDQARALLTYSAMENTMMLSALEAICYRNAPLGDLRYTQIVNAYATSAARRIERW